MPELTKPTLLVPMLVASLQAATIVRLQDYQYFVHPLTDGIPDVDPGLLAEVLSALQGRLPTHFDRILAPEAMGLPLATGLTLVTGKPFVTARKRSYGFPDERVVEYETGYSKGRFYLNGIRAGERLVLVDDVASRGGTIRALAGAVKAAGARLEKTLLVVNKGLDLAAFSKEVGSPVEALVDVAVRDGRVQVTPRP